MKVIIALRLFAGLAAVVLTMATCPAIPRDGHPERSPHPLQSGRQK